MATRRLHSITPWPMGGSSAQHHPQNGVSSPSKQHHKRQATPAVVPHSRFVEGSMSDRVSAPPPPTFVDHAAAAAYERQFYEAGRERRDRLAHSYRPRPMSSAGHYQHEMLPPPLPQQPSRKGGFLAPLWDGVRERFHLTRSRSSGDIGQQGKRADDTAATVAAVASAPAGASPAGYPTREEVLESYKNLMASGFFDAHAIHGTRHPLKPAGGEDGANNAVAAPVRPLPPPVTVRQREMLAPKQGEMPPPKQPFMGHLSRQSKEALKFSAIPYSATRQPTLADLPSTIPPPRQPAMALSMVTPDDSSLQRGTKRGSDTHDMNVNNVNETGARKLVKKLRRSGSRVSSELTGTATSYPSITRGGATTSYPPITRGGIGLDMFKSRSSISSNAPSVASGISASTANSGTTDNSGIQRTSSKLTKSLTSKNFRRVIIPLPSINLTRRANRGHSPAPAPSAYSQTSRPVTPHPRDPTEPSPLAMNPVGPLHTVSKEDEGTHWYRCGREGDDIKMLDFPHSPPPVPVHRPQPSPERSPERPTTALAPPSFHYPQRVRAQRATAITIGSSGNGGNPNWMSVNRNSPLLDADRNAKRAPLLSSPVPKYKVFPSPQAGGDREDVVMLNRDSGVGQGVDENNSENVYRV
ncbi:hypothetical protein B0H67DRAFT_557672 [Lasiosphaeris hirsuta]|uniref:Uncharacterized protein n=1 Tax=Lasiosphaeris hirsuta TaxID=260670 RepID=A0AA39ZWQ7_9PEZI|nr:hypothetical protein B0H67DRAFT_557672 [Lasiosphaeris hirsuta]